MALAAEVAPRGIELLVIKGQYIVFGLTDSPLIRPMCDADALVVTGSIARMVRVLRESERFAVVGDNVSTKVVADLSTRTPLDLHRWPLPPRFGRMRAAELKSRAHRAPRAFGPHLLVPDPTDAAAIAIANFVKDSVGATGPKRLELDLTSRVQHASFGAAALG